MVYRRRVYGGSTGVYTGTSLVAPERVIRDWNVPELEHGDIALRTAKYAAQNNVQALNDYAWLLSTSEFAEVRNGPQAVTLASQAVARNRTPAYLDTLAAAYAETGKFDRAVQVQREAIGLAGEGDAALVAELEELEDVAHVL